MKKLSIKFPLVIYYKDKETSVEIYDVLDLRKNPSWIREELQEREMSFFEID